jgi:hypothetical protein
MIKKFNFDKKEEVSLKNIIEKNSGKEIILMNVLICQIVDSSEGLQLVGYEEKENRVIIKLIPKQQF